MYSFWHEKNLSTYTAQEYNETTDLWHSRDFAKAFFGLVYRQEIGLKQQPWLLQELGEC
jgi:hypothetical protein